MEEDESLELFSMDGMKQTAKDYIKENKSMMLLLLLLVVIAPFLYMYSSGYSATKIVVYYAGGMIVIFFMIKMARNMFQQKKDVTKKGMIERRARAQQAIDEIDAKLEEEAGIYQKKLKEIRALQKPKSQKPKKPKSSEAGKSGREKSSSGSK